MPEPIWLTAFRSITNATNERSMVSSALGNAGVGNSAPLYDVTPRIAAAAAMLLANFNSIPMDWVTRFSVGGTNMNFFIVRQLPVLEPVRYLEEMHAHQTYAEFLAPRVLELTYTAWDLEPFARDLGYKAPPFIFDGERRFLIRCELDAAFFHLYLGREEEWHGNGSKDLLAYFPKQRDAVSYIMETFPIVKRKDEAAYGHYRTKDTILEIYDEMAEAIRSGKPYQTRLNPPPGPPLNPDGSFAKLQDWPAGAPRPKDWPPHIHEPRRDNK